METLSHRNEKKNRNNGMTKRAITLLAATVALLGLAAPVAAQENHSSVIYSQEGEISPGTTAP